MSSLSNPGYFNNLEAEHNKLKVAVLTGGIGEEREISLQSGDCVSRALADAGFNVVTADINPGNLDVLEDESIDVFFVALHGKFGEDGQLQQILEDKALVYTGSGPKASKLSFDKMASKKIFTEVGVATATAAEFSVSTEVRHLQKQLKQFGDRYVVKPIRQGSSIGVNIVSGITEALEVARETISKFGDCMIEQYIAGREITVGILNNHALPILEVRPQDEFCSYHAKYIDDSTKYLFDTIGDRTLIDRISESAMKCFNSLECRDIARVDFILGNDNVEYVLELNTIPGLTTHSWVPKAAAKVGFSMSELCKKIVESAIENRNVNTIK